MRRNVHGLGLTVAVSVLALSACEPSALDQNQTAENTAAARTACIDPATGELIQPGPDTDCKVPAPAGTKEAPVVRDLEGGGKAIDLKGQHQQHQIEPASSNRLAVIDPKTGKLLTSRPEDALAAARYDRSVARAWSNMKRRQAQAKLANDALYPEPLPTGGVKIDVKGHFQIPLVAKLSKDGQIRVRHQH